MQLIITALGDNGSDLFEWLLKSIRESECQVQECRMTQLGDSWACFLLVHGKWNHIAKLESGLTLIQPGERIFFQRLVAGTGEEDGHAGELLYVADIIAREGSDVLDSVVAFVTQHGIGIQDLRCSSYQLPYVNAVAFTIHLLLRIPPGIAVLSLRDEFLDFCEQLQVDAIFEPIKPVI